MLLAPGFPSDSPVTAEWVPAKLFEYSRTRRATELAAFFDAAAGARRDAG